MTHPSPGYALLLLGMLLFMSACGGAGAGQRVESNAAPAASSQVSAPAAARPPAVTEPAPSPGSVEEAWRQVRAALPADVAVYQPLFVPERFGAPTALETRTGADAGPVYTVVYTAADESLAFVLNRGKGAWGNFPPAERTEPITVLGVRGELAMSAETHALGVFWNDGHGRSYQIKAISRQMAKDELVRIAASLVPVSE